MRYQKIHGRRWVQGAVMLLTLFFLFMAPAADDSVQTVVKRAMDYYLDAKFDDSIKLLQALVNERALSKKQQVDVFTILSRAYTAKSHYDEARAAVAKLLALEPPLIKFNPEHEPPPLMKIYFEMRKQQLGSFKVERLDPGIKTIAIFDFKNRSVDARERFAPMQLGFSDLMIHQMHGATDLLVVERERIEWILDEIKVEQSELFDSTAVRIGKQLGVHTVVFGSFIVVNNEMWLGARVVKVETSEILLAENVTGKADKFFDLITKLSQKVAKQIGVEISQQALENAIETESLDAMLLYSEGLALLDEGDYDKAYTKFQSALRHDPHLKKAGRRGKSIAPYRNRS